MFLKGVAEQLRKFVARKHEGSLQTKDFPKSVGSYSVDISFGMGQQSKVPYMSFLSEGVKTRDGYYPVYLYYPDHQKLILAYGVSETVRWSESWPTEITKDLKRIESVIPREKGLRYLDSWVAQVYETNFSNGKVEFRQKEQLVDDQKLERDLEHVLAVYGDALPDTSAAVRTKGTSMKKIVTQNTPKEMRPDPVLQELKLQKGPKNTVSLIDALRAYKKTSIKDYQRSYQWTNQQIDELFDDLYDVCESPEAHFFGSLIIQEEEDDSEGTLVDGQQRITTVFIIVSALRDELQKLGIRVIESPNDDEMDIEAMSELNGFLFSTKRFDDQRFESNRGIRQLLRDNVVAPPNKDGSRSPIPSDSEQSTRRFVKAVKEIRLEIQEDLSFYESDIAKAKRNYQLFRALSTQFRVMHLQTRDLSESLEIFITLNNRGLPLGPSDIVRGEVMTTLSKGKTDEDGEKIQGKILQEWEDIEETVIEPEIFLRHFLVANRSEKIQKKKIVSKMTETFKDKSIPISAQQKNAKELWLSLSDASSVYGSLVNPLGDDPINYKIAMMEMLSKSQRIMLLGIFSHVKNIGLQSQMVHLVFVLSFKWVMANKNAQKLEDTYQKECTKLREGVDPERVIESLIEEIDRTRVDAADFLAFEGDSSTITRVLLHLLHRYQNQNQELPTLDSTKFHLEHIAPKTPTDHWMDKLVGMSATKRDYNQLTQMAGNLLLLDKKLNIQAQQKRFRVKCDEHYSSATFFAHTNDVSFFEDWTPELINKRTRWMADMFDLIFDPYDVNPKIESFVEWYERH